MRIVLGTTKYEFVPLNDAMSVMANSTSDCNHVGPTPGLKVPCVLRRKYGCIKVEYTSRGKDHNQTMSDQGPALHAMAVIFNPTFTRK